MTFVAQLAVGVVLSVAISIGAQRLHALTADGAVAASLVGTLIFGFGGWRAAALLVLFFATSSLLTRWHAAGKPHPEHRRGRAGSQVLANGTTATVLAVWFGLAPSVRTATAFAAAIAASTADTWATELGLVSRQAPRLITTGRIVTPGRSGGVTWVGTLGGLAGAAIIAAAAAWGLRTPFAGVWAAGSLAMVLDSLVGATIEGRARWLDNNAVNLFMTAAAALVGAILQR